MAQERCGKRCFAVCQAARHAGRNCQAARRIALLSHDEAESEKGRALLRRYGDLEHEYAHHDGYNLEVRARAI